MVKICGPGTMLFMSRCTRVVVSVEVLNPRGTRLNASLKLAHHAVAVPAGLRKMIAL